MKVLRKGVMPDGTKMQLEDWSDDLPTLHSSGDMLAAYPIAKASAVRREYEGIKVWPIIWEYPERHKAFRLSVKFPCAADAEMAFNALLEGSGQLLDYVEYMEEKKYADCI